jgi:PAS domain S-box-containing protein
VHLTENSNATDQLQRELGYLDVLFELARALSRAQDADEIYSAALTALICGLGADRAAVLIRDPNNTIRLKAWVNLSEKYRSAVDGHTMWPRSARDNDLVTCADVLAQPSLSVLPDASVEEGIRALAVVPLLGTAGLFGNFVLYYDTPHEFEPHELQLARTIGRYVAFAVERNQSEQALKESERRFVLAQNGARLAVWDRDLRKDQIAIFGEYARLHGLAADHPPLTYAQWLQLVHPDDRKMLQARLQNTIETNHLWDSEFRVLWSDGSVHWLHAKGEVFTDDAGRPVRMVGVSFDITERKKAEELRSRLAAIVESSDDGIVGTDLAGVVLSWNRGAERLYGYSAQEMVGQSILLVVPQERHQETWRILEWLRQGERLEHFETVRRRKDGRYIDVSLTISPVKDGNGAVVACAALGRDITEKKQAETILRESEERFRKLADAARLLICSSGPDKGATFFNKGWLDFTGRSMHQELGFGWIAGVHPDDLQGCLKSYTTSFDARRFCHIEYRLRRADGEYRWMLCTGVPQFGSNGKFTGYIASCIDITEVKRAHETALARQKLESLGRLVGGIAHDFNNQLGSIIAGSEVAEADLASGLFPVGEIRAIRSVAVRTSEIVRELMVYAGHEKTDAETLDLSLLVAGMLDLLRISISKNAILTSDLRQGLPLIRGNAAQLRQIVMNLVINASEAIGANQQLIHLATSLVTVGAETDLNETTNSTGGRCVRLEVLDNGCGMTEETRAKIFDPFFTTKFGGRGMGLAVVQGIVRAHDGAITVTSVPGRGTSFQVSFPCATQIGVEHPGESVSTTPAQTLKSITTGTVLLVEDEDALRRAVSKILRRQGFSLIEAANGSAAIDLFRGQRDKVDVIVLDMTMPGISSLKVIMEVASIRPDIKIILTSAYSREMLAPALGAPQVRAFLPKPFTGKDLVQLLRETLSS